MKRMFNLKKRANIALVLIALMPTASINALTPEEIAAIIPSQTYTIDGIHYRTLQIYNTPFQLEVTADEANSSQEKVALPSELSVECPPNPNFFASCPEGTKHPAVITRIGDMAFAGENTPLRSVIVPSSVKSIGKHAFAMSWITDIELSEGLQSIEDFAFNRCRRLKTIKIPESVKTLGIGCFYWTDLKEIDLPSTLESMDGLTFRYCGMLSKIICRATIPPVADSSDFGFINHDIDGIDLAPGPDSRECVIYVPKASIDAYHNAPGWKDFYFVNDSGEVLMDCFKSIEEDLPNDVSAIDAEKHKGINYVIEGDEITVACEAGDRLEIYDTDGICLQRQTAAAPASFTHKGKGIRIISVNGKSAKVVL